LGKHLLVPSELGQQHSNSLLKSAKKNPRGFSNLSVISETCIGPIGGLSTRR